MPRGKRRTEEIIEASGGSAMYDRILAQLKPDREITAGEFLKRAFTFPMIDKIKVQKFSGGTWNFAEDIDNIGPAFDPGAIEAYLREKYGPWRFRLCVIVDGVMLTQHVINLDGWQENEAKSVVGLPRHPTLTPASKPVGSGATSELLERAKERVEIENTTRLLQGLERQQHHQAVESDAAPVKMMMEMMTGMMGMFRELITAQRGGMAPAQEDRFVQYLTEEVRFMRDQLAKPAPTRDADALTKTITTIDDLLNRTLNTSLSEMLTGASKTEATGWAATIQGVIEGVKPYLPELLIAIKSAGSNAATPALRRNPAAQVIPFPIATEPPTPASPSPTSPPQPEEEANVPKGVDPVYAEVITMLLDALRSKNFKTIDAILMNPPLQGRVVIDPEVPAATYAMLFKSMDLRFGEMRAEIGAYQEHLVTMIEERAEEA